MQVYRTGQGYLGSNATAAGRIPAGHPEGYLEAFANIYKSFSSHIRAFQAGEEADEVTLDYPTIKDGVRGMRFIDAVVESSKNNASWTALS